MKARPRIRDEFGEQRSSRRATKLSGRRPGPNSSVVAALAACVVLAGGIVFVLFRGAHEPTSAEAPPAAVAPAPAPKAATPPPAPTFTESDWKQAHELADLAKAKASEADAARERGDEPARKKLRAEALDLYEKAITIWQKTSALPEAQQNLWNDKYGDTVHRWFLAKRKLM